jgi:hypothetical protein
MWAAPKAARTAAQKANCSVDLRAERKVSTRAGQTAVGWAVPTVASMGYMYRINRRR